MSELRREFMIAMARYKWQVLYIYLTLWIRTVRSSRREDESKYSEAPHAIPLRSV